MNSVTECYAQAETYFFLCFLNLLNLIKKMYKWFENNNKNISKKRLIFIKNAENNKLV